MYVSKLPDDISDGLSGLDVFGLDFSSVGAFRVLAQDQHGTRSVSKHLVVKKKKMVLIFSFKFLGHLMSSGKGMYKSQPWKLNFGLVLQEFTIKLDQSPIKRFT